MAATMIARTVAGTATAVQAKPHLLRSRSALSVAPPTMPTVQRLVRLAQRPCEGVIRAMPHIWTETMMVSDVSELVPPALPAPKKHSSGLACSCLQWPEQRIFLPL